MLEFLAESIRKNKNILEKLEISPIVQFIEINSYKSERIFKDIGEDAAAVNNDNNKYILLTTDRIKTSYVEKYPFGAGFSSILVSIDDIYACGGIPLAASLVISVKDDAICKKILEGICEASKKFRVPIIRGHTNPHGNYYELSSTVIGEIFKENYISAGNAKVNDNIILVVDFEGKVARANKYYWDTVTFKNSEEVLIRRKAMNIIAETHFVNASKDISNGGIFGTILQMIKYSKVGASVNINNIEIPPALKKLDYTIEMYAKMYLTTSFILTASDENCNEIIQIFKKYRLIANVIGKIIKEKNLLRINDGRKSIDVIKF